MVKNKTKKIKGRVTIEDLAVMVQGGFVEVNSRLDGVDKRLDGVDKRLDGVDKRFDGVDGKLIRIKEELLDINLRLATVEGKLEEHTEILNRHSEELAWMHQQIDKLVISGDTEKAEVVRKLAELDRRLSIIEKKAM